MIRYYVAPGLKYRDGVKVRMKSGKSMQQKMSDIIDVVCQVLNVERSRVLTPCRQRELVTARQIAMYLIRKEHPEISLKNIGSFFMGRDHTTVIHGIQAAKNLMETDTATKILVGIINDKL